MLSQDDVDQLVDECERSVAVAALDALTALCEQAEAERMLTQVLSDQTASGEHSRLYGHRLKYGCCLRAFEDGKPSMID